MLEDASRDALRAPRPAHYALIAQGDEVLSWQEMTVRHPNATLRLLSGSDHAISDFAQYLDEVLDFLQLA